MMGLVNVEAQKGRVPSVWGWGGPLLMTVPLVRVHLPYLLGSLRLIQLTRDKVLKSGCLVFSF